MRVGVQIDQHNGYRDNYHLLVLLVCQVDLKQKKHHFITILGAGVFRAYMYIQ